MHCVYLRTNWHCFLFDCWPYAIVESCYSGPSLIQIPLILNLTNPNPHINDIHGYFDVH